MTDESQLSKLRQSLQLNPKDMLTRLKLAELLMNSGNVEEAMQHFEATRGDPKFKVQSLIYISDCFKRLRMKEEAIHILRQAEASIADVHCDLAKEVRYRLSILK